MIADDHPFAREGLELLIRADSSITIHGTSDSFATLLEYPKLADGEVLLRDVSGTPRNAPMPQVHRVWCATTPGVDQPAAPADYAQPSASRHATLRLKRSAYEPSA